MYTWTSSNVNVNVVAFGNFSCLFIFLKGHHFQTVFEKHVNTHFLMLLLKARGTVRSAASSYAAMRIVAGSRPVLVIA